MTTSLQRTISDQVTLDSWEAFNRMLERMTDTVRRPHFRTHNWTEIIEWLQEKHLGYFGTETGPNGPWQPLKPATVAKKGHDIILFEESLLRDSLSQSGAQHAIRRTEPAQLIFGTDRPWAWTHQEGTKKIPQREHTGLNNDTLDDLTSLVADTAVLLMMGAPI